MSGGSYDYMYDRDQPERWLLERMRDRLRELGLEAQARETEALLVEPSGGLRKVWRAVEWLDSNDWGKDQVLSAVCEAYGHVWAECADACDRCGKTGTEVWAA